MTEAGIDEAYGAAIEAKLRELNRSFVLSDFWRETAKWPAGGKDLVFIGTALQRVGLGLFGDVWTGNEFWAARSVESLPSFSGTLVYFVARVRKKRGSLRDALGDVSDEPVFAPPITRKEIQTRLRDYHNELEQRLGSLRPMFEQYVIKLQEEREALQAACGRLDAAVEWVREKGLARDLRTYLIETNAKNNIARKLQAPSEFWHTSNPIEERLGHGFVELEWDGSHNRPQHPTSYHVFVDASDLDQCISGQDLHEVLPDASSYNEYPYVSFMLDAIKAVPPEAVTDWKKERLVEWLEERAPGHLKLSAHLLDTIATLIRPKRGQHGGAKAQRKSGT